MNPLAISHLQSGQALPATAPAQQAPQGSGGFSDVLKGFAQDVNDSQNVAAKQVADLAAGNVDNVHKVMIELGKAEVTFGYMMEVRNKLIDAYKEVMRMQM